MVIRNETDQWSIDEARRAMDRHDEGQRQMKLAFLLIAMMPFLVLIAKMIWGAS